MKKTIIYLIWGTFCGGIFFSGCKSVKIVDYRERFDTITVLKNPHKGWYQHYFDNGIDKYKVRDSTVFAGFEGMDHIYLRLAWSYLEPEEGKYNWTVIDTVINRYVSQGYGISFRISCKETGKFPKSVGEEFDGVQYATPRWVEMAGAQGVIAVNSGLRSWTPDWGNSVFLSKLEKFHIAFAERYGGKSWLRYVDIGSIGEWGEGHTSFSTKKPITLQEVKSNIDLYRRCYKNVQLVATDDLLYDSKSPQDRDSLYRYAVNNGLTLRDDSPMVDWYLHQNSETWSVSHPEFYDPLYLKKPIIYELQHYHEVVRDGNWKGKNGAQKIDKLGYSGSEIMRKSMELMHATYIGFHGFAEDWLRDNRELSNDLANRSGYWYFPMKAKFPAKFRAGKNTLEIQWLNNGFAPAYNTFSLIVRFENKDKSFDIVIQDSGNKNWLPNQLFTQSYKINLPQAIAKGDYKMSFKLVEKMAEDCRDIQVGISKNYTNVNGFIRAY